MVGYGCVDSSDPGIESVDTIKKRIEAGIDVFSPEALIIDPDCGLRMQSHEVALGKLKAMVAAARQLREDYSL
jgi:5-methyltetrahydropteroyltriglutamate--homocysteine methyltransferase